jgi:alkylated DNA nucleotide flippase Atl1
MSKRRSSVSSSVYAKVAGVLDGGFRGTYRQLAHAVGSHPRAVGSVVRRYSKLNPAWDHMRVFSARTGRPALYC